MQGTLAVSGIENSTEPSLNGQTLAYVYGHADQRKSWSDRMKMMATIELEFESGGEATHNAMDQALIRGLEALKKGIELREDGTPRRSIKPDSTKWNIVQRVIS